MVISCSSDDAPDTGVFPDATVDAGVDAGPADTGVVDAGPSTCDPIANSGCSGGDVCKYSAFTFGPECGPPGANGNGEVCSPGLIDCGAGFACFALEGETDAICRKACLLADGTGCEGLTGPDPSYACNLQITGEDTFGFCTGCPTPCHPLREPCGAGEVCTFAGDCDLGCATEGTVPLNGDCSSEQCAAPGICVGLNGGPALCYEPCRTALPQCSTANYSCVGIGETFGLCAPI